MMLIGVCVTLVILGFVGSFLSGFYFGGQYGMMVGFFCGMPSFMALMLLIGKAKNKGFIKLYRDLKDTDKEYEKFVHFPDSFGRIRTLIGVVKQPGRVHVKGLGDFDDKGDEYAWGMDRACFALPHTGMTIALKKALYTNKLEDEGIKNYDSALKRFLGETKFNLFKKTHRNKVNPDADDIRNEVKAIIETDNPDDPLERKVLGETVGFKDFAVWLLYAFNPVFMDGAIMQEKLIERKAMMDYRDKEGKYTGIGKMILYILFDFMIFLLVIGAMWDSVSQIFSGFLG